MSIFKNRTVVGALCILLSLLISFGVAPLFNRSISETVEIVRVTRDIRAGDMITTDMVSVVRVGGYNLPNNVIRQLDSVVGRYATAGLVAGDHILAPKLSDFPAAENAHLYSQDGNRKAISITIRSLATGLSGKLQRGDIVSVIAPDYRRHGQTVIPPVLQFVEVINVTASSGNDANVGDRADSDDRELPATVTFLVTVEQSRVLAELEADGRVHLSLVYRGMPENAALFIAAQDEIIKAIYRPEELDSPTYYITQGGPEPNDGVEE